MAASTLSSGLIDPTKQADYPVILGDRLAGKSDRSLSQLINIQYNYKSRAATAQQRSVITKSPHSRDHFNLTITDDVPNADQNALTYSYQGSVDPAQSAADSQEHNLVLVFDETRKAFVLEPVATQLNFNLRAAPSKSQKQAIQQYPQLRTLQEDEHNSGDDRGSDQASGNDDGPADDENPYDFRHFLPKDKDNLDNAKSGSGNESPEPHGTSKAATPLTAATKPALSPRPRPKTQTNPLRQKKPAANASRANNAAPTKSKQKPSSSATGQQTDDSKGKKEAENGGAADEMVFESKSSPSDTGTGAVSSQKTVPSPGSNIIVDGDLIIDMGSPPPARPFKVNPAHFSSNNTPSNNDDDNEEDGYEDIEDLRLPSPAPANQRSDAIPGIRVEGENDGGQGAQDEDDLLAAEMEAAFEEEARSQQPQTHAPSQQYAQSEDESEVSEEE